jgi:hypothetical protein
VGDQPVRRSQVFADLLFGFDASANRGARRVQLHMRPSDKLSTVNL